MKSFEDLVHSNMKLIYSFSSKFCRTAEDRDDLVQETLLRAHTFFNKYEQGTNFNGWVFTIMRNIYLTNYGRKKRDRLRVSGANGTFVRETFFERESEPKFDMEMLSDEVTFALSEIRKDYVDVLIALVEDDLEYKEISEKLSIPVGTVMSRLFRAKNYARKSLADYAQQHYKISYRGEA
jgi:RNA polymerase sigma factor (sigma-70 family)